MEIRKIKRNKPRIALLLDTWFPVHTGKQVYTAKLAATLAKDHGYEVDIYTRAIKGPRSTADQVPAERALGEISAIRIKKFGWKSHPWNLFLQVGYVLWAFFSLLYEGKNIHLYHAQSATSAFAMKSASWFTGVPTILTVHASHVFDKAWTLRKIVHRVMFLETKYSQELSISEAFLKASNVNESVFVAPYGVHVEEFDQVELERSPNQFNVLYVGRLDTDKGLDVLLKAAQKVIESTAFIQSQKDFLLHLAGEGPDRKSLEQLSKKLKIAKYLRFHGLVTGHELIRLYKACDLFVLPSRKEALPFSILEAACARLPLLATNTGDLRNVVIENVNGHLAEPDDAEDLAYYLEQYAANPHLETLGQASYDLVTQEYTWEKSMHKLLLIYERLLVEKQSKLARSHEHVPPWCLPLLFWRARNNKKVYKSKTRLKFCLTVKLAQAPELPAFLERFSEFCAQLEIPSTLFTEQSVFDLLETQLKKMQESGHELGVKAQEKDWLTSPMRRSSLWSIRKQLDSLDLQTIRMFRPPFEVSEQDLEILHETGFETLPVSEDPWPHIEFHWGVPFGSITKMNLKSFLELDDWELLEAVNRLRAYQKKHGIEPFLIFECDSSEFTSREDCDYASGENFTLLSKKIAFLKEHMELQCLTLSDFCKSCSVPSV